MFDMILAFVNYMTNDRLKEGDVTTTMRKILIVDDQPFARQLLRDFLVPLGYATDEVPDGFAACQLAAERRPDLILMDLIMPGMDGVEACRRIKGDSRTSSIPVLIVTTARDRERLDAAFEAGADDYLAKPFSAFELQARIKSLLVNQELRQVKERLERELKEKAVYESIFEHASEGLLALNVRSEVVYINRAALDILGYSREEMLHLTLQDFWAEESYQEAEKNHMSFFLGGDYKKKYELVFKTRSGEKRWVTVSVSDHWLKGNCAILAFTDVTHERQS